MNNSVNNKTGLHIRRLTAISLFCALAYICVFTIRFKVSFLTFDLKDAIMAIGAMYFGPIAAVVMPIIVSLIEFLTISDTGVYGLIMNFLSSFSFCLVSSLIYRFRKTLSGAVMSLAAAVTIMTTIMLVANCYITPYYMGVPADTVRQMIPTLLLPFNLIKGVVNASVMMLLYKSFSKVLKASGVISYANTSQPAEALQREKRIFVEFISLAILIVSLLVLFLVFNATLD